MVFSILLIIGFYFLWKKQTAGLNTWLLPLAWAFKLLVGVVFMIVYSHVYGIGAQTVDWEEFIHDSIILKNVFFQSPGDYAKFLFGLESQQEVVQYLSQTNHWSAGDLTFLNDSKNVMRFNSVIAFVSGGNIYMHIAVFSFFVVLGLREIYLTFYQRVILSDTWFWVALVVFPSLAFWTSSMLKEPPMILGFALVLRAVFGKVTFNMRVWRVVVGVLLMLGFKPYVLICLVFPLLFYVLTKRWSKIRLWWVYVFSATVLIATLFAFKQQGDKVVHYLTRKQFDFINIGEGGTHVVADSSFYLFTVSQYDSLEFTDNMYVRVRYPLLAKNVVIGMNLPFEDVLVTPEDGPWKIFFQGEKCGSVIQVTPINKSLKRLLLNIPEAFVNAAFRPFIGDPGGRLKYLNALETVCLFGLFGYTLVTYRRVRTDDDKKIILTLVMFSVVLLVLIGWTTPVLGAIVRYRVPAYLALFICSILSSKKLQKT